MTADRWRGGELGAATGGAVDELGAATGGAVDELGVTRATSVAEDKIDATRETMTSIAEEEAKNSR